MYRLLLTSRLLDEAALRQNRMGRAPFVVPASGHEGCQVGTAWAMRRGTDVWLPYYRDLGVVLVAGMTPYEVFLGVFAKADDPSSGGRQMPVPLGVPAGWASSPARRRSRRRYRTRPASPTPRSSAARTPSSDAGSATAPPARATGTRGSTSPASTDCR